MVRGVADDPDTSEGIGVAAEWLREIAAGMAASATEEEELARRQTMEAWKKSFFELAKKNPRMQGRDIEQIWQDYRKCLAVDAKGILRVN